MNIFDSVRRLAARLSAAANPQPASGSRTWTGFVWTEELLRAKAVLDGAPVVLLTGEAGTGKSTFIREYRDTTRKVSSSSLRRESPPSTRGVRRSTPSST